MIRFALGLCLVLFLLVLAVFAALPLAGPFAAVAGLIAVPLLLVAGAVALPVLIVGAVVAAAVWVVGAFVGAVVSLALFAIKVLLFVVAPIALLGYLAIRLLAA